MSYLTLLLAGLLPPIAALLVRGRRRDVAPAVPLRHQATALTVLTVLAVLTTLPWDAALIAWGTWNYPQAHLIGRVAGVPVEELLFMVLQPVLVGVWLRGLSPNAGATPAVRWTAAAVRAAGAATWACATAAGVGLIAVSHGSYLGWLLIWAAPLLGLQWAAGGDRLWAHRRLLLRGTAAPVLYLCALDRLALHLHLWQLSAARTTGRGALGLPVEEGLFFLLTTLLVAGGLLLATDPVILRRLRGHLPHSCRRAPTPPVRCLPADPPSRPVAGHRPATALGAARPAGHGSSTASPAPCRPGSSTWSRRGTCSLRSTSPASRSCAPPRPPLRPMGCF